MFCQSKWSGARSWSTLSLRPRARPTPRLARSRNRLLEAAGQLLATGGVEAVTVEAVTRMSKVARATLYRHFGSTTDLLAATFERLLPPPVDTDIDTGRYANV